jgi:hypothetical protein
MRGPPHNHPLNRPRAWPCGPFKNTDPAAGRLGAWGGQGNAGLTEVAGQPDEEEWATLRAAAPVLHKLAHM